MRFEKRILGAEICFLLVIGILICLFLGNHVQAQESDVPNVQILGTNFNPEDVENLPQTPEEAANVTATYLRKEWTKIMEKYPVGRFFLAISSIFEYLNFYWVPVLGMEYSFSLAFLFGLVIWALLFYFIYGFSNAFFNSKFAEIIGAFSIVSLIGTAGVIKRAVDMLNTIVSNRWIAWLSLFIAVLIMLLIFYLSGGLKEYFEKQREKEEKRKTEEAEKLIQVKGKIVKKELESL